MSDRERAKEWIDEISSNDVDRVLYFMNLALTKKGLFNERCELKKEIERLTNIINDMDKQIDNLCNNQKREVERLNNIINETEKEIDRLLERQYESERFAKEQGFDTYLPAKENLLCVKNKLQELKGSE